MPKSNKPLLLLNETLPVKICLFRRLWSLHFLCKHFALFYELEY